MLGPALSTAAPPKPGNAAAPVAAAPATGSLPRFTDTTPDEMITNAKVRAMAGDEHTGLGAIAIIASLADRASYGAASRALRAIADSSKQPVDVKTEAALAARALSPDEGTAGGIKADRDLGVLTHLSVVGPFRDTGGGLTRKEGPEAGDPYMSAKGDYSWGTVAVNWREMPESYAPASGVPLDVFVAPRKESCSYVATRVELDKPTTFIVRLAATGSARLVIDGVEGGSSDDVNEQLLFERVAARVDAAAGAHVIAAKICSAALDDEGRVRLRVTDAKGEPLDLKTSVKETPPAQGTKVLPLVTPLQRLLATTQKADTNTLLDAILARTLGASDDLKSPRAPGLLDAFTHTAGLDADRFALAAWVAPSGSNRSGWLLQAAQLAGQAKDTRTQSFANRRLVAQHLSARMADWARASATTVLAGATDSEAVLMDALVDEALGTDTLKLRALRHLEAYVDAHPTDAPTSLVEELANLSGSFDMGRALATRDVLARRGQRSVGLVQNASSRGVEAMIAAAKSALVDGGIADADEAIDIVGAIGDAGAHDAALDMALAVIGFAPNRPEAWSAIADEAPGAAPAHADAAAKRLGAKNGAALVLMALERARELAPGEARYRVHMALRTAHGATQPQASDDEKYMVPSGTILARRLGVPARPDCADRQLHWVRAVVMHPDRRVSQLIHYAREIVIAPRTQEELYEQIPTEGDTTEILRARVHRKDGGVAYPLEEHNEGTRPKIRWPDLLPGDTVEVAVRSWTDRAVGGRGDPPYYFLDYAGSTSAHPILYNEVVVEAPPATPIFVDVLNAAPGTFERTEKDENGRHVTRLVWSKPPTVAEEPLSPALSEIVPVIAGSTFKSWTDFRAWYAEAVRGFTEPDEQVKRMAAELTKGKTTREQKLKALFDFVADDIRYVNFVSGEFWLPNRPQQLLARREGDCDDKAILLITLLRAVGIEAQEVLVQTRETGQPSVLLGKNVAIPLFDHGIAFLPGPNGGMYLDATSPQSRLGPLPSMDARAVALRMDAGPAEIVRLPNASPDDHGSDVTWTITLKADGSGELSGIERHTGDGAFFLRTYLGQADARAQYVEDNLVGGWFPTVEVDKEVGFDGEQTGGAATVKYKARSEGLARRELHDLVVPFSPSWTYTSALAPIVVRTMPVSLPPGLAPSHQTRTMRITAPAGYQYTELPPGGTVDGGEFGKASLEVMRDPANARIVVVKRSVSFDLHLIPVDKYGAWRAWLQRVDALMHKGVRLVPEESLAKGGAR